MVFCYSDLGNALLSGQLVPQLGQLKNLQYLYVHLYVTWIKFILVFNFYAILMSDMVTQTLARMTQYFNSLTNVRNK